MINVDNAVSHIEDVCGDVFDPSIRGKILALEDMVRAMPQVDLPLAHLFSGNIYARTILIPKGTVLTGRMYLTDHIDLMVYGDMTVTSDYGTKNIKGFNLFEGKAGKKRAGYAHKDTLWITFCACEEMTEDYYMTKLSIEKTEDYDKELIKRRIIDELVIIEAFKGGDYEGFKAGYLAGSDKITKLEADRMDFSLMAGEIGISEAKIRRESEIDIDMSSLECEGVYLDDSPIEGKGLFTNNSYNEGDDIMLGRVGGERTIAGRYTNHSILPNAVFVLVGDDIMLMAITPINNQEVTIDYRESFKLRGESCQVQ